MDRTLDLPSGNLAVTEAGDPEAPAIMLIHGLGSSRRTWEKLIVELSETHHVLAPDLPGHGDSEAPDGDYSLGAHATALRDVMVMLGVPAATIVGHSLGGGVALQFAYQFPERTQRIALLASGGLGPEVSAVLRAATLPGAAAVITGLSLVPTPLVRRVMPLLPALVAREDAEALSSSLRGLGKARARETFLKTAHAVISWRGQIVSAVRRLHLLNDLPVLVAWGDKDRTIPPSHHRRFAEEVPTVRQAEIPGAGHFLHETDTVAVMAHLQDFLNETEPFVFVESDWRRKFSDPSHGAAPSA